MVVYADGIKPITAQMLERLTFNKSTNYLSKEVKFFTTLVGLSNEHLEITQCPLEYLLLP
jgi:hypothetical protein